MPKNYVGCCDHVNRWTGAHFSYPLPKLFLLAENYRSIEDGDSHVKKKETWSAMETKDFIARKASSYCKSIKIQGNLQDL